MCDGLQGLESRLGIGRSRVASCFVRVIYGGGGGGGVW